MSSNGICGDIPFTKFKVNRNSRYNIFECANKTKTQIRAGLSSGESKTKDKLGSKHIILLERLTNEICTYLYIQKCLKNHNALKNSVMKYYGAFSCEDTAYFHMMKNVYGNANVALSKMNKGDQVYIKELFIQILGVLYACDNVSHGKLTLENIHVYPSSFKLVNFENGVIRIKSKRKLTYVGRGLEYTNIQFKAIKNSIAFASVPSISNEDDAMSFVSYVFMRGFKSMDAYTLLVSIACHKRFSSLFLNLHNNKKSLEYILQSVWHPRQRPFILLRISENIGKNSFFDCVKFLTTPLQNGEMIILRRNLNEVLLKALLD
jgi:hypothetical protein